MNEYYDNLFNEMLVEDKNKFVVLLAKFNEPKANNVFKSEIFNYFDHLNRGLIYINHDDIDKISESTKKLRDEITQLKLDNQELFAKMNKLEEQLSELKKNQTAEALRATANLIDGILFMAGTSLPISNFILKTAPFFIKWTKDLVVFAKQYNLKLTHTIPTESPQTINTPSKIPYSKEKLHEKLQIDPDGLETGYLLLARTKMQIANGAKSNVDATNALRIFMAQGDNQARCDAIDLMMAHKITPNPDIYKFDFAEELKFRTLNFDTKPIYLARLYHRYLEKNYANDRFNVSGDFSYYDGEISYYKENAEIALGYYFNEYDDNPIKFNLMIYDIARLFYNHDRDYTLEKFKKIIENGKLNPEICDQEYYKEAFKFINKANENTRK